MFEAKKVYSEKGNQPQIELTKLVSALVQKLESDTMNQVKTSDFEEANKNIDRA